MRAESARLLAKLNQSAQQAARDRTSEIAAAMDALVSGPLQSAGATEIERSGRARLAELAVAAAGSWRQQQAALLEGGLAQVEARILCGLQAELQAVREAASDLLGLALARPQDAERLSPDLNFFFLVAEQAGQTELLAGAIRRHLPGGAGRRRARAFLRRETTALVPQQIGRARADLQYRLAEATRQLVRATEVRYRESTGCLESALRAAIATWEATAGEAAQQDRELAQRQQVLNHVIAMLDKVTAARGGSGRGAGPPDASATSLVAGTGPDTGPQSA